MKNIKIMILVIISTTTMLYGFDHKNRAPVYLGIMEKSEKVYKTDKHTITRKLTSCAKNKGWLQDIIPAKGVTPITEIDILEAYDDDEILIVDMRMEIQYINQTIPGSVNVPFDELNDNLEKVGCIKNDEGKWSCAKAKKVYGFCNGPVCPQSPKAMRGMIKLGFPANKIFYYRGGMFSWIGLGLTTVDGEF